MIINFIVMIKINIKLMEYEYIIADYLSLINEYYFETENLL